MPTSAVEDYLKCIHQEQERRGGDRVSTGRIAAALRVAPGTATAMVKALAESGLVVHEPYAGVRLTPSGARLAAHVLRRHRLMELFLVRVMGMDWTEVHEDAEVLEHAMSDRLLERIDVMLGRPEADPHGDPIPPARGRRARRPLPSLLDCPLGTPVRLARVTDQRPEFLRLLESRGLRPGRHLTVRTRDELADTVEIRTEEGRPLRLGWRAASRVLVERNDTSRSRSRPANVARR